MNKKITFAILFFMGILMYPGFVLAKYDYYVDIDASNGGDGSKENPFNKIKDALDAGGGDIFIKKGNYSEVITLGKGVKIKGDGSSTTIKGVIMKDNSYMESVKIDGSGVFIGSGDSAKLSSVTIINSDIGLKTEGSGTVKISNSEITKNRKGMYIQKDKDIEIISCSVSENNEEGIDIRQNVDGVISGNKIKNNAEGGIEVIAGGSELKIANNSIQGNKASGIAIQYYEMASKNGALRIYNNSISSNGDYAVTCKNPSGGSPGADYWTDSVDMGSNSLSGNKDGEFAPFCKFSNDTVHVATKTKEELEQERLEQEKKENEERQKEEQQKEEELKQKEEEEKNRLQLEEEKKIKQEELVKKMEEKNNEAEKIYSEFLVRNERDVSLKKEVESRSKTLTFIIGSDYKKLDVLAEGILTYNEEFVKLNNLRDQIEDQEIKNQIDEKMNDINEKEKSIKEFIVNEVNKFSLFGWFFNLFKRP